MMRAENVVRNACWSRGALAALAMSLVVSACAPDLDTTRQPVEEGTFGETLYGEACQRVAWTAQLDEQAAGLRAAVDVTGQAYAPVCWEALPAPSDAPVRLRALAGERARLVAAVDGALPDEVLTPVRRFLDAIVVLDDDGTIPRAITATVALLDALRADAGLAPALAAVDGRGGFRPAERAAGLPAAVADYAGVDHVLDGLLGLLLDEGGQAMPELRALLAAVSHGLCGLEPVTNQADPERTLAVALRLLFGPSQDARFDAPPGEAFTAPLALRDARGAAKLSGAVQPPFVDGDGDGLPDVGAHGRFVDGSGAALAVGRPFVTPGETDAAGARRDEAGRLVDAQGQPVYAYTELSGTVLEALLREVRTLSDPHVDNVVGLLAGASSLLGPRQMRQETKQGQNGADTLAYLGFDLAQAPLLDLAHAYVQLLLGAPRASDVLLAVRTLLTQYEAPAARALAAMLDMNERGKRDQAARIPEASTFYDQLTDLIVRILRVPGLPEDLMDALADPHVRGLGPMIARLVVYKDRFVLDQNTQRASGRFATPVDRSRPDSDLSQTDLNRSILQRLLHLVHDANGVELCNKQGAQVKVGALPLTSYDRCKMFRIADLGLFFALTIADRSITDDKSRPETRNAASFREQITDPLMHELIQDNTGALGDGLIQLLTNIDGFTRFPTPYAAARTLFIDPQHWSEFLRNSSDAVQCADGDRFIDVHADTIFAWEQPLPSNPSGYAQDDFYDAVRPVVNAFARHDECIAWDAHGCTQKRNAAKIFVDLVSLMHEHWGSPESTYFARHYQTRAPTGARYQTGDGVVSYEPLLAQALDGSDLMPSLLSLVPVLNTMTLDGTPGGERARPLLVELLRYVFDPQAAPEGLAYRDGHVDTTWSDGKTRVPRASPYYLLADAYAARRHALAVASQAQEAEWKGATSALVDEALTVENAGGAARLKNRRLRGVVLALVDFVRGRLATHQAAGDAEAWVRHGLTDDLTDLADGPVAAALLDLATRLEDDPGTVQQVHGLLSALLDARDDGTTPGTAIGTLPVTLTAAGDLLQLFLDDTHAVPIARAAGLAVDPTHLEDLLVLVKRARAVDPNAPRSVDDDERHATLVTLLRNFLRQPEATPGRALEAAPIVRIGDVLGEVNRTQPGHGGDLDAADYRSLLASLGDFLGDEQRGFMRFVAIVQNRRWPALDGGAR